MIHFKLGPFIILINSCLSFSIILSRPKTIMTLANILQQQILSIPKKVRKKSNGFSSPMLTDANDFFLSSSEFRIFLSCVSAKPYHLFKKEVTDCNKDITDVTNKIIPITSIDGLNKI